MTKSAPFQNSLLMRPSCSRDMKTTSGSRISPRQSRTGNPANSTVPNPRPISCLSPFFHALLPSTYLVPIYRLNLHLPVDTRAHEGASASFPPDEVSPP